MPDLKFSVVIPVYNREMQIRHCIDSVLSQDYPAFEVIVVDDGSTDRTAHIIQSITDPRLRYIRQVNKERGAARNNGWNNATGDYVTFLDSDDEFLPGHLKAASEMISDLAGYRMYCTAYLKEGPRGIERISIPEQVYDSLSAGNFLSCNGVFVSTNLDQFRFSEERDLSGLEDWLLWLQISKNNVVAGAQTYTSKMNHHAQRSVLNIKPETLEKKFQLFFAELEKPEEDDPTGYPMDQIRASGESYMALHLAMSGYRKEARKHLWRSLKLQPNGIFTRRYFAILKYLWF